jgi:hypothetical protein
MLTMNGRRKEAGREGIVPDCQNENLATLYNKVCQVSKILATIPSTRNQLSLSGNELKLTYGNVEFQNFPGEEPRPPAPRGGKGRERGVDERRGVAGRGREGREGDGEVGGEGVEGKG